MKPDRWPLTPRRAETGFTLIEMLVALAVFSVAVLALLILSGESTRAAAAIEERAFAGVVAENRAVEAQTAPSLDAMGPDEGVEAAGGRNWRWTRQVGATADPGTARVDIVVEADEGRRAAELTVFRPWS